MATSAFKSTSKRTTTSSSSTKNKQQLQQSQKNQNLTQKAPPRRSRSLSAFSRTHLDTTSEFQNKTDNPLFSIDGSPNSEEDFDGLKFSNIDIPKFVGVNTSAGSSDFGGESRRGRSISRNFEGDVKSSDGGGAGEVRKSFGRSLPRVDKVHRRRSSSGGHYANSESEKELENEFSNFKSKSKIISTANRSTLEGKNRLARSASDLSEILKGRNTWSSQHPVSETSDDSTSNLSGSQIPCWDDGISTSYFSEAEEKTIKPVSEETKTITFKNNNGTTGEILETVRSEVRQVISDMQNNFKHAMLRSNSDAIHNSIISDFAPESENSNTFGLVQDFREEFERELEECEERRRKLRAELAVEEHREIELNQILNDIVPEPKTPVVQKPRAVRKASYERKRMSKHLEEEALAYFDECVSISTFDDSEFSSLDDLQSLACVDGPGSERVGLPVIPSVACILESQDDAQRHSAVQCNERCNSAFRNSCNNSVTKSQFSFTCKPSDISLEDVRNYVKHFCKDSGLERNNSHMVRVSRQNPEDHNCEVPMEKLLLDKVTFRSRIESGSMLLCDGSFSFSLSPFSSTLW
ncbi:Glucocorticoid modulatory element-binding protein 2 [Bienertia sinuspersici]